METIVIKKCAWCNKVIGTDVWQNGDGHTTITHGMCESCRKKMEMEIEQYYKSQNKLTNQLAITNL